MKKEKILLGVLCILFIFFLVLLFAEQNGYYETRISKAKTLTEEQIKEFEKDIQEGKEIDVKDYVIYEKIDYSNNLSKGIYKVSLKVEKVLDKGIKYIFKKASKVIEE